MKRIYTIIWFLVMPSVYSWQEASPTGPKILLKTANVDDASISKTAREETQSNCGFCTIVNNEAEADLVVKVIEGSRKKFDWVIHNNHTTLVLKYGTADSLKDSWIKSARAVRIGQHGPSLSRDYPWKCAGNG